MARKWSADFRRGTNHIQDDPQSSGKPATTMNQETIARVCDLVMADR